MNFDTTKPNVGNTDRLIRAIVGVLLLVSAINSSSWAGGIIGVALLASAYFRFCPSYAFFGFSSNKDAAPLNK